MLSKDQGPAGPVVLPPLGGRWPAVLATGLVLAATLGLTGLAWQRTVLVEEEELRGDFDFLVRDAEARIGVRMEAYEQVLRGAAARFGQGGMVSRGEFRAYVATLHLEDHYPGIQGLGFSLVVPAASLAHHTGAVRGEGFPTYQVRPPGPRDPYTSIVYLEPFAGRNLRAFGYDMFSEPVRRDAMERARDEGKATLSGKVTLVQETTEAVQFGVLMYHPVYRPGAEPLTVEERRERLVGWAYIPFRMGDLMEGIFGAGRSDLATRVFDGPEPSPGALLFDSAPGGRTAAPGRFHNLRSLGVVDRTWAMAAESGPAFDARLSRWAPAFILAGGLSISVLLALLFWSMASARDRAVRVAGALNRQLLDKNAALVAGEARLGHVLAGTNDGFWDWHIPSGRVVFSDRWASMLGYALEELEPSVTTRERLVHPQDLGRVMEAVQAMLDDPHRHYQMEHRVLHKDGHWVWILDRGKVVERDGAGAPIRAAGTHTDITERKRVEFALQEREARLRAYFESPVTGVVISAAGREFLEVNDTFCAMLGRDRDEVIRIGWRGLTHPDDLADDERGAAQVVAGERASYSTDKRYLRKDGSVLWAYVSLSRATPPGTMGPQVVAIVTDIGKRKAAEAALQASERRLEAALAEQSVILANATVGITLVRQRRQIWASAHMERMLGYSPSEMERAETRMFFPSDDAWAELLAQCDPVLHAGRTYSGEHQLRRKDGTTFWARLQGRLLEPTNPDAGAIWCIEDVSDLKLLGARASQAERVAATATLARGMAHEVNNPLASIIGNLGFVQEQLEPVARARPGQAAEVLSRALPETLQAVRDASESAARIKTIVADLRAFALGDLPAGPGSDDLAEAVGDARRIAAQDLATCRAVTVQVPDGCALGVFRPDLVQLLAHLLINAGQATGHGPNDVRVAAAPVGLDRVALRVTDTGTGMTEAVRARAFEPFFTTRDVGKGRGLGLSVCLGIAQAAGGEISLESAPGSGTTVTVELPRGRSAHLAGPLGQDGSSSPSV